MVAVGERIQVKARMKIASVFFMVFWVLLPQKTTDRKIIQQIPGGNC
jgi:hypothetical protein